jgi:hypothetical protein
MLGVLSSRARNLARTTLAVVRTFDDAARQIPRPAGEGAGLRDDAILEGLPQAGTEGSERPQLLRHFHWLPHPHRPRSGDKPDRIHEPDDREASNQILLRDRADKI